MKTSSLLPVIISWGVGDNLLSFSNHECFARSNHLRHFRASGNSSLFSILDEVLGTEPVYPPSSVILLGPTTYFSSRFISGGFQEYFVNVLDRWDVILPITQPPAPRSIGSYGIFLRSTDVGLKFFNGLKSQAIRCGRGTEGELSKSIIYATLLDLVGTQPLSIDPICTMKVRDMHSYLASTVHSLHASSSSASVEDLLSNRGVLLAHDPFVFNAAVIAKLRESEDPLIDTDSWKDGALDSMLLHIGGASLISSEIYIKRLLGMLGFGIDQMGCVYKGPDGEVVGIDDNSLHLLSQFCMVIMLFCLLSSITMVCLVLVKLV